MSDANDAEFWSLESPLAIVHCGVLTARVNLAYPQSGLHQIHIDSAPVEGRLFSFLPGYRGDWPARLADAYVRGADLVATYEPSDNWPYAPQIYWRVTPDATGGESISSLTLIVSIQTSLLDTHPRVEVVSELAADEILHVATDDGAAEPRVTVLDRREHTIHACAETCALVWRLAGSEFSYVELAPASDFRQVVVQNDSHSARRSRWELFAEFLEKGVIRRAQIQMAIVPRANDLQLAAELCRTIERRPLPLTT